VCRSLPKTHLNAKSFFGSIPKTMKRAILAQLQAEVKHLLARICHPGFRTLERWAS
jgi:hypothetical protein